MTHSATKPTIKPKPAHASRTTKKDQLIKLLGSKSGTDIKSLSEKLGWQPHTTRAAMSGLRKAGYEVTGEKPVKGSMSKFRILSVPAEQRPATATVAANAA